MKEKRSWYWMILLVLFYPILLTGQNIPLNIDYTDRIEEGMLTHRLAYFSTFKPLMADQLHPTVNLDSLLYPKRQNKFVKTWLGRKLCNENFFTVDTDNFHLTVDPVFDFQVGEADQKTWVNTRGFWITGSIGKNFTFHSDFFENQAVFPGYLENWSVAQGVVPGQGATKGLSNSGFDFSMASAYISYTPSKYLNIQFGHGKNFIGDGYRSMILSDNAFNYPYLRITTTVWKLQYTNLFAQFLDKDDVFSQSLGYTKKYGTFHFLSTQVTQRLNIGLFEAIIWESADSTGSRGFDINYLNPVIFYRPVEFSLGSPDNALVGLTFKYRISGQFNLYGQLMLDEFKLNHVKNQDGWWANKQAFQVGLSGWNILDIQGLKGRTEFNYARPYTYSHNSRIQSYSHYNQALAHPLGANFEEWIGILSYTHRFWEVSYKLNLALYGKDTAGINFGGDIFLSYNSHPKEINNYVGQGLKTTLVYHDFRIAYLVNLRTHMKLELGLALRQEKNRKTSTDQSWIWFGISTSLRNIYYDF